MESAKACVSSPPSAGNARTRRAVVASRSSATAMAVSVRVVPSRRCTVKPASSRASTTSSSMALVPPSTVTVSTPSRLSSVTTAGSSSAPSVRSSGRSVPCSPPDASESANRSSRPSSASSAVSNVACENPTAVATGEACVTSRMSLRSALATPGRASSARTAMAATTRGAERGCDMRLAFGRGGRRHANGWRCSCDVCTADVVASGVDIQDATTPAAKTRAGPEQMLGARLTYLPSMFLEGCGEITPRPRGS